MAALNAHRGTSAERLIVGLRGAVLGGDEAAWLEYYRPAGVILFGRNVVDLSRLQNLCADVRRILGQHCEIVADHEGGPVSVLAAAVGRPPAAASLGALNDPDLTERVHRDTGSLLSAAGVDRALAPCCDVLSEPRNAVIGARSFGADPGRVAAHVGAAVRGLIAGGVRSCPKHWPGHGGTPIDTHLDGVIRAVTPDFSIYAAAVGQGADAVMVGHLPLTDGGVPASLDRGALDLVADRFPGAATWSDDMTMAAVRSCLVARTGEDPGGQGMVETDHYPASWLDEAARHCGRLLIRGIPWQAMPLDVVRDTTSAAPPCAATAVDEPESWREARQRGVDRPLDRNASICWIDFTEDHRWGALARDALDRAGHVGVVRRARSEESLDPPAAGEVLLVTSHRPLAGQEVAWLGGATGGGQVLVLGHPTLAADLARGLPEIHHLSAGYDASVEELAAWFGR